ncbi:hypothetical protein BBF96_00180 [Anoxybacter fermentans]|uniref:Uncharacterized protein n=1 Tax=Anoxybacter fermentans TaxID=1323375 RepID=A0A3S9SUH0_9FIRM|nr:hypothetical protein [Anoxybacter fermentans]AZR71957.1 hypothetical protein BBF96_00180 [Anoxybacter fermentans]
MWTKLELIYELDSPLHIGYLPFTGSVVSPTRYYVPGKNLWGAVTRLATEYLFAEPTGEDYRRVGEEVKKHFRFSYFYILDGETIYYPCYSEEGLIYGNEEKITKAEFEYRFIGSRVSTAIDRELGSAKHESLHEIEFINHKYMDKKGNIKNTKIIGAVWVNGSARLPLQDRNVEFKIKDDGVYVDHFNLLQELILGGEQNYGFGRVRLYCINKGKNMFPVEDNLNKDKIIVTVKKGNPVLSHVKIINNYKNNKLIPFRGDIELLSGREYSNKEKERFKEAGKRIVPPEYYFSPGTVFLMDDQDDKDGEEFILSWSGIMDRKVSENNSD